MIEAIVELLLQLVLQVIGEMIFEFCVALGWESLADTLKPRQSRDAFVTTSQQSTINNQQCQRAIQCRATTFA